MHFTMEMCSSITHGQLDLNLTQYAAGAPLAVEPPLCIPLTPLLQLHDMAVSYLQGTYFTKVAAKLAAP
jgi:hypothetical protein